MSTKQDIYAAGSENRPTMLNKDNYVPWSSRLLCYAKSKPNGKLIYNSIMNGPYVRRMIPKPGDSDREVPFAETFHEHTDDELTENEQMMKGFDIGIQDQKAKCLMNGKDQPSLITYIQQPKPNNFILQPSFNTNYMQQPMLNPKDITDLTTVMNMALVLMAKAFKLNYSTPTNNNHRISSNPRNRQIAQPGMNLVKTDRYKWLEVVQNVVQNLGVQNVGNQNGLIVVPGITNLNANQIRNGNIVVARAEGNVNRNNRDLEEIEEVKANCILMANLQQASTSGVDNTTKTRRPQPTSSTKNDKVRYASKSSCIKNNEVEVEEHHRNLLLFKNKKHMSSECNNIKLDIRNDKSEDVCAMCKQCLITTNHDVCVLNYVNGMKSRGKKQKANVSNKENQKKHKLKVTKPKKVIQICLWCIDSGCSKHMTGNLKLLINFVWKFLRTARFGNDHLATILGYGDLQWRNILITRVYFVEALGHNMFLVRQFCDSNLEVAFRRNTCFVRNLEGVYLLKGNHTINLYTINLYEIASASPICLIAHATSTKSWLWHQRLSHLNFNTINDLAKNDLVTDLPKFKYHKEYLCPSCKQGKSKKASHPPKPVPNSKQMLHLLHVD
uniref:Retrovirus-related Pol polyprotein from transposon TNT 1-94 n=1 Tax=Tanacetum cinerariifolium TaxID=118510 RepID=A0A699HYY4_TANCI|nr:retrovirus-related Pol polyprotein from transposon TNT 1-94 [Tanacetum cinerariifolium]